MMSIFFLYFLILSLFLEVTKTASVNAIETKFPFRNGKIFVILQKTGNEQQNITEQFYSQMPNEPVTVLVSVRTLEIINTSCKSIDYSFTPSAVTKTGFNLSIALSQTYNIFYSQLVLDYFSQSNFSNTGQFFIYNTYPTPFTNNNGTKFVRTWTMTLNNLDSNGQIYATSYIQKYIAQFPSGNFYLVMEPAWTGPTLKIHFNYSKDISITLLEVGGIIYNNRNLSFLSNFSEYKFDRINFNYQDPEDTYDISNLAFPNLFLGITNFNTNMTSNKIQYSLYYDPQFSDNTSYSYVQSHGSDVLNQNQSMGQTVSVRIIHYSRTTCASNTNYPLLDYTNQLCYDVCPDGMYQSSSNCTKCTKCTTKSTCTVCYSTGCSAGLYFNTASTPYQCSTCPSGITNCINCFANITSVYCQTCDVSMNYGLSTDQKNCALCPSTFYPNINTGYCTLCNNTFPNCKACSQTSCTNCTTTSKTELISGVCMECNSTSFFYPTNRSCLLCSTYNSNCETCVHNTGLTVNCTSCLISSKTIVSNQQCVACGSTQFYYSSNRTCISCDSVNSNCETCVYNTGLTVNCTKCTSASQTEVKNQQCVACNSSSFYYPGNSICLICSSYNSNCEECIYISYLTVNCTSCSVSSKTVVSNQQCVACGPTEFYYPSNKSCVLCASVSPNCENCIYNTGFTVNCSLCLSASQTEVKNKECVSCNMSSFYYPTNRTCISCNSVNPNCESCIYNGSLTANCTSCSSASETQLLNQRCVDCDYTSYYESTNKTCVMCSFILNDCETCIYTITHTISCTMCTEQSKKQISNDSECIACNSTSYYEHNNRTCQSCSEHCTSCSSSNNCFKCLFNQTIQSKLQNNQCVICNPNNSAPNTLPFCHPSDSVNCILSTYNLQTEKCESTDYTQVVTSSFTILASIPTLSIFTQMFGALMSLLDDLSYYTYHGRDYSDQVEVFLAEMTNYTISKFIPFRISIDISFYSFQDTVLLDDLGKTPKQFEEIDGDTYFLHNTETLWSMSIPISILVFWGLCLVHWIINKFVKNNIFKNYNYFAMIFVDLIGSNLQYLSFRVFQQLYQSVLLGIYYYINVVLCYIVLFIVIIYAITGITLFKIMYQNADSQYILEDIFGESWATWFMISNILKIFTGFIHAYFFYSPFIQTSLLTLTYLIRLILHSLSMKHMLSKFQYSFEFCNNLMMLVLEILFLWEIIMMKYDNVQTINFSFGNLECIIVLVMIANQLVSIIVLAWKNIIVTIKSRTQHISKKIIADIKINKTLKTLKPPKVKSQPEEKKQKVKKQQKQGKTKLRRMKGILVKERSNNNFLKSDVNVSHFQHYSQRNADDKDDVPKISKDEKPNKTSMKLKPQNNYQTVSSFNKNQSNESSSIIPSQQKVCNTKIKMSKEDKLKNLQKK